MDQCCELLAALEQAKAERWRDIPPSRSQASLAVADLLTHAPSGCRKDIQPDHMRALISAWRAKGLAPSTINKRMACLGVLGVPHVQFVTVPNALKWWLKPQEHARLTTWLRSPDRQGSLPYGLMADYVDWTTYTGMRVQENLRLTWADMGTGLREVTVPGLKTFSSQATLPLSKSAVTLLQDMQARAGRNARGSAPVFPVRYSELLEAWGVCRRILGVQHVPGATLKALRRGAARHLTLNGMPTDVLRQYLRHEDIHTTMGYLRLTGGYNTAEMRRWLK